MEGNRMEGKKGIGRGFQEWKKWKGMEGNGREWKGMEGNRREGNGSEWKGMDGIEGDKRNGR